jgi:hypothetical protein
MKNLRKATKTPKRIKTKNNNSSMPLEWDKAIQEAKTAVKSLDKKIQKQSKGNVPASQQYDWLNNTSFNNIIYPKDKIPDRLLRMVERRNGIVASIITLRIQQALEFSNITHDKDVPGWELILKDNNKTLSSTQKKQKQFLEEFLSQTKVPDYEGLEPKYDDFKDLIIKFVRDRILIDKVCWEIERDNAGRALAIWVLDGATIFPIMPGGYYGSISQIGYGNHGYNKLADEIRKSKLEKVLS